MTTAGEPVPAPSPAAWVLGQLADAWRREGRPAEPDFRLSRFIVVLSGLVSLLLLAAAVVTILSLDTLWRWHEAAGFALLPVLAAKLVPIGVRAVRYYWSGLRRRWTQTAPSGGITPPVLIARLTAPALVAATALLLGSGIVMWHTGDQRSLASTVHNVSAIAGGVLLALHIACHARSTLAVGVRSLAAPGERATGGGVPPMVVAGALVGGIILAVLTVPGASWNAGRGDRQRAPDTGAPPAGVITTTAAAPPVVAFRGWARPQ